METIYAVIQTVKDALTFIRENYSVPLWVSVGLAFGVVGHIPALIVAGIGLLIFAYATLGDFKLAVHQPNPLPAKVAAVVVYGVASIITILSVLILS